MANERIRPPKVERPFVFVFDDDEVIELTARQYGQMALHFEEVLCTTCDKGKPTVLPDPIQ